MTDQSTDDINLSAVRELLELITQTDVSELCYERGGARLTIKREPVRHHHSLSQAAPTTPVTGMVIPERSTEPPIAEGDHLLPGQSAITAPIVGTFYTAPSPKDRPYIEEGDIIEVGDPVGIIEAMKMQNTLKAWKNGVVSDISITAGVAVKSDMVILKLNS